MDKCNVKHIALVNRIARHWYLLKWFMIYCLRSKQGLMVSVCIFQLIKDLLLLFFIVVHLPQLFEEVGVQSCLLTFFSFFMTYFRLS